MARPPPRPWAPTHIRFTSEAEFDRLCSSDTIGRRCAQSLDDSEELTMLSGKSTPVRNESPLPVKTPPYTYLPYTYLRRAWSHRLAEVSARKALTTTRVRCRPTRGHVAIKTRASQKTGFPGLLCIAEDFITVVGGAELDETVLSMPLPYAVLKVVPDLDNVFELKVKTPDDKHKGISTIFLAVSNRYARDLWLEAFSAADIQIEGWRQAQNSGNIGEIDVCKCI
jgi:hypothetical protein